MIIYGKIEHFTHVFESLENSKLQKLQILKCSRGNARGNEFLSHILIS